MEYNFLEFIDSPAIRDYNKGYNYTPAEQAVLIMLSEKKSIECKLEALQYLVDTFSEEAFEEESVLGKRCKSFDDHISMRDIVIKNIDHYNWFLKMRYNNDNNWVFEAVFGEQSDICEWRNMFTFSSYDAAVKYLISEIEDIKDDDMFDIIPYYGVIEMKRVYADYDESTSIEDFKFILDKGLQIVDIHHQTADTSFDYIDLSSDFYVHVNHPFKKGDLIKENSPFLKPLYGVFLPISENDRESDTLIGSADRSDMRETYDVYDPESKSFDWCDHAVTLHLDFVSPEELPDNEKALVLLSEIRKENLDFSRLLWLEGSLVDDSNLQKEALKYIK